MGCTKSIAITLDTTQLFLPTPCSLPIQRSVDVGQEDQPRVENNNKTTVNKTPQWLTKFANVAVPILDIVGPFMLKCCGLIYEVNFNTTVCLYLAETKVRSKICNPQFALGNVTKMSMTINIVV